MITKKQFLLRGYQFRWNYCVPWSNILPYLIIIVHSVQRKHHECFTSKYSAMFIFLTGELTADITLPVHARYHRPSRQEFTDIVIKNPRLMIYCAEFGKCFYDNTLSGLLQSLRYCIKHVDSSCNLKMLANYEMWKVRKKRKISNHYLLQLCKCLQSFSGPTGCLKSDVYKAQCDSVGKTKCNWMPVLYRAVSASFIQYTKKYRCNKD